MSTRAFSIEDGNTQVRSITSSRLKDYSDIDLTFTTNTAGDVYKKLDAAAVKQAVKTLILTDHFERPFKPYFGTNIRSLLFELFEASIKYEIEVRIRDAINAYEPRAYVEKITAKATPDENALNVTIVFKILNTKESVTFTTNVSRVR